MQSFQNSLTEHLDTFNVLHELASPAEQAARVIAATFKMGNSLFVCGNGGSAADAQHFASELSGRFEKTRPGYPAIALTTDSSALTAIANDFGYERIFARQLESLGRQNDLLLVISTSGNSANLREAVHQAKSQKIATIGLLGRDGGELAPIVDLPVIVPGERTSRIQEAHIFLLHYFCEIFEP
ncbi:MAG: SIS domain-containing protein [Gammaproteobacteria bacterium]|nr:SIS domain-containing protein [Gammaproteobacteria bacterium]